MQNITSLRAAAGVRGSARRWRAIRLRRTAACVSLRNKRRCEMRDVREMRNSTRMLYRASYPSRNIQHVLVR